MALQVSETFRQNCYDLDKKQRLVLVSNGVLLSNEDIDVDSKVRFNLASITAQQVKFGETPTNTICASILNEDGRITADSIVGKEFNCSIGVEVSDADYHAPSHAISAILANGYEISVHSVAPYVRGNCSFTSLLPQLLNGDRCKIMFAYDAVFFVVDDGTERYYAKHTKTGEFKYGAYATPSSLECAMLDRLMDISIYDGIAYYDGGMAEFFYDEEYHEDGEWEVAQGDIITLTDALPHSIPSWTVGIGMTPSSSFVSLPETSTWGEVKAYTWQMLKSHTWGDLSGYSVFNCTRYETVSYGVWHFDRPRRINTAVLTLNGKDRMTVFDEDSANFASSMANTAITVKDMVISLANYKNVSIGDLSGMNELAEEITVNPNIYYNAKSLKDLLSYCGEVCGVCIFFDRWGQLACTNSDNEPVAIPYCYSFDVADYTAHTIGKMLIYHQGDFFEYQEDNSVTGGATYEWGDNPFFNKSNPTGSWFSEDIHKKYGGFRNAITSTDADYSLWCDDVYSWTEDNVTYREPIFAMTVEWNGSGSAVYENYGEETRPLEKYDKRIESVTSVNDNNLQGFNKAQYAQKLSFDENGLTVEANGMRILNADNEEVFYADSEGNLTIEGQIKAHSGNIGNWEVTNNGLVCHAVDQYGKDAAFFLEPRYGDMQIKIQSFKDSQIWISSKSIYFSDCDANGDTNDYSGALQFSRSYDGTEARLTLGWAVVGVDLPILRTIIGGDIIQLGNHVLMYPTTTTSSANMCISNNRVYISSSVRKLKDNIKTIENPTEKVDNLRGVSFTSKCEADDPNRTFYGFIAEEVEKAVPELATYEDGELQSVQYDRVCALLVEDLKACHKRIETLESRLAELEKRLK